MSQSGKKVVSINDIFGGGARLIYANDDVSKPTKLSDILNTDTGVLVSGWNDLGATDGGAAMTRGFDKETWDVDQVLGAIDEFITSWNVMLETNLAEASLENLQLAWEGGTINLETGESPDERSMGIGDPGELTERMIAFVVDKRTVSGVGYIRAYVYYKAQLDGSDSEHRFTKGEKVLVPLTLKVLADTSEVEATRFGVILDQVVGTS